MTKKATLLQLPEPGESRQDEGGIISSSGKERKVRRGKFASDGKAFRQIVTDVKLLITR